MLDFEGQQGIELEGLVRTKSSVSHNDLVSHINGDATGRFNDIDPRFYRDDGKPEYPSRPYSSLRELEDEISRVISGACEVSEKNGWIYELIGADPWLMCQNYSPFGSTHFHCSIEKEPTKEAEIQMRRKFFSVQPFIELLGMNTCIFNGKVRDVKDARIAFSSWSKFTHSNEYDTGHYMALASGRKAITCEVRLPSSAPKDQVFGIAVFLKAILMMDKVPVLPLSYVEDTFYKVIKWGGQAVVSLCDGSRLSYLGVDGDELYVTVADLFKKFLEDKETRKVLDKVLSELSASSRKNIMDFYKLIASGYTVSDLTLHAYENYKPSTVIHTLGNMTSGTYKSNGDSLLDHLKVPEILRYPPLSNKLSLEDVEQALLERSAKLRTSFTKIATTSSDINNVLLVGDYSVVKHEGSRNLLKWLVGHAHILNMYKRLPSISKVGSRSIKFFIANNVIESVDPIRLGTKFHVVAQVAKDRGLI